MTEGKIIKISGPLVVAENMSGAKMYDLVRVGRESLIGEIVILKNDKAFIQVYEETAGLMCTQKVVSTEEALSVDLAPGLIGSIFDGIQRPLDVIRSKEGDFISRGINVSSLDKDKLWHFRPVAKAKENVEPGDILGEVKESKIIMHKIMVPPGMSGQIEEIKEGEFKISDTICKIKTKNKTVSISMLQRWPVRIPRPVLQKLEPAAPLITGQRVVDTFFPVAKGGTACIPGPFGSGKTVMQHQLAKWSDADIIVYIGCGERGNEMTDVLLEFPQLKDPKTGESLMERTVLVANTSNMPVAAREASIYTGITIAEYYRDMGYDVAIMADSTSRWAEALREMSGRLEEMPGEEGYPAYLGYRIAEFYERAGRVICMASKEKSRQASLTIVGAVSPPGGDLSDPVVQATLRVVKVFWSLEDRLAHSRHFPAIHWLTSYSLYSEILEEFFNTNISTDFSKIKKDAMRLLQEEAELIEIARLVGVESLSDKDRLVLETAKSIREDFLHQNATHEIDTYTSLAKQYKMLKNIMSLHEGQQLLSEEKVALKNILELPVTDKITRSRYIAENQMQKFEEIAKQIKDDIEKFASFEKIKKKGKQREL
ncbi:MAG: V-type ATP synthase subunit A [Candidatus Omnitrophica bacterium]|nr:V-type ATP synthase subunit A [Candidatus Omnitrophota bacterium]